MWLFWIFKFFQQHLIALSWKSSIFVDSICIQLMIPEVEWIYIRWEPQLNQLSYHPVCSAISKPDDFHIKSCFKKYPKSQLNHGKDGTWFDLACCPLLCPIIGYSWNIEQKKWFLRQCRNVAYWMKSTICWTTSSSPKSFLWPRLLVK